MDPEADLSPCQNPDEPPAEGSPDGRSGLTAAAAAQQRQKARRRHTVKAIAEVAGVGLATVDRVLHGRPGVRAQTAARIWRAIAALDDPCAARTRNPGRSHDDNELHLDGPLADLATRPPGVHLRFDLIVHAGPTYAESVIGAALRAGQALRGAGIIIRTHPLIGTDPARLGTRIRRLALAAPEGEAEHESAPPCGQDPPSGRLGAPRPSHGLVVFAPEDPAIHAAIDAVSALGVPVVCIGSDLPASDRLGYVGIDQAAAGRTAAHLLHRILGLRDGGAVVITTGDRFRAQADRELGFRSYLRERCPDLILAEVRGIQSEPSLATRRVREALDGAPRPLGIYATSGGNPGIAAALESLGARRGSRMNPADPARILFIGHGLDPATRTLLVEDRIDAIIHDDIEHTLKDAFLQLRHARQGAADPALFRPRPPVIMLRENLV